MARRPTNIEIIKSAKRTKGLIQGRGVSVRYKKERDGVWNIFIVDHSSMHLSSPEPRATVSTMAKAKEKAEKLFAKEQSIIADRFFGS